MEDENLLSDLGDEQEAFRADFDIKSATVPLILAKQIPQSMQAQPIMNQPP